MSVAKDVFVVGRSAIDVSTVRMLPTVPNKTRKETLFTKQFIH
jgi:hypothetical protein